VRNATRNSKADESPRWFVLQALGWSRKDALAFGLVASATIATLVNDLLLQTGSHPAPMFKGAAQAALKDTTAASLPRTRPAEAAPKIEPVAKVEGPARASADIVADIQRELARRGFYDGLADGRYGSRTDAAVRDFEQAAALKPSAEPNEALLAAIRRSQAKSAKAVPATGGRPVAQPVRLDPIAELLAPSKRVIAVQRALAEYGYGQLKPTGVVDAETKAAVEKFERERKLPITGQVSERVARELAAITGRPLE
jgi:peptidoglycan hydrolase-like protein with peptidoglycan-binding domain